jgi:hypothetical protein
MALVIFAASAGAVPNCRREKGRREQGWFPNRSSPMSHFTCEQMFRQGSPRLNNHQVSVSPGFRLNCFPREQPPAELGYQRKRVCESLVRGDRRLVHESSVRTSAVGPHRAASRDFYRHPPGGYRRTSRSSRAPRTFFELSQLCRQFARLDHCPTLPASFSACRIRHRKQL